MSYDDPILYWAPMAGSDGRAFELRHRPDDRPLRTLAAAWQSSTGPDGAADGYTWSGAHYDRGIKVGPVYRFTSRDAARVFLRQCPGCGSAPGAYTVLHAGCDVCEAAHDCTPTAAGMARYADHEDTIRAGRAVSYKR